MRSASDSCRWDLRAGGRAFGHMLPKARRPMPIYGHVCACTVVVAIIQSLRSSVLLCRKRGAAGRREQRRGEHWHPPWLVPWMLIRLLISISRRPGRSTRSANSAAYTRLQHAVPSHRRDAKAAGRGAWRRGGEEGRTRARRRLADRRQCDARGFWGPSLPDTWRHDSADAVLRGGIGVEGRGWQTAGGVRGGLGIVACGAVR